MLRRYIVPNVDVPAGTLIPIDNNPNVLEQTLCNVCGVSIEGHDAVWASRVVFDFFDESGRRSLSADICAPDKARLTLAGLQTLIMDGSILR